MGDYSTSDVVVVMVFIFGRVDGEEVTPGVLLWRR
jgi:hypothetical protein